MHVTKAGMREYPSSHAPVALAFLHSGKLLEMTLTAYSKGCFRFVIEPQYRRELPKPNKSHNVLSVELHMGYLNTRIVLVCTVVIQKDVVSMSLL
jgi:hypothetical protein